VLTTWMTSAWLFCRAGYVSDVMEEAAGVVVDFG
jgi:hypothetical protein